MQKKAAILGSVAAAGVLLIGGVAAVGATGQPGFVGDEPDDQPLTGSTLDRASKAAIDAAGGGKVTESEHSDDDGTTYEIEVTLDNGNHVDVELDSDYQVVSKDHDDADGDGDEHGDDGRDDSDGDDRDDQALTGSTLDRASKAAIDAAGGGKVTESEHSDDDGTAYEIEVTLDNGKQVDVELDSDYQVVSKDHDDADHDD